MKPFRILIVEAVDNIAYLALFYGIFAMIMYVMLYEASLLRLALIALPFWGNFVLRRIFKNFWVSLVAHSGFPIIAFFLLPEMFSRVFWVGATIAMAVYSLKHYFRIQPSSGSGFMVFGGGAIVVLSIGAAFAGYWPLVPIYPPLFLIMAIGRMVLSHMLQMDVSLEAVQLSSAQPVERIISFNYKLMAGLSAAVLAATLLLFFVLVNPAMNIAAQRFQFPWTLPMPDFYDMAVREPPGTINEFDILSMLGDGDAEPSLFGRIMSIFLLLLGVFSVAGAVILVFIVTFNAITNGLNKKHFSHSENASDTEDTREFIRRTKTSRKRRDPQGEHPIRRLFRKTVSRHIKMGVPIMKSDTPTDISKRITSEDISSLASNYADIRYRE